MRNSISRRMDVWQREVVADGGGVSHIVEGVQVVMQRLLVVQQPLLAVGATRELPPATACCIRCTLSARAVVVLVFLITWGM